MAVTFKFAAYTMHGFGWPGCAGRGRLLEIAQRWMQRRDTPAWFTWHCSELARHQAPAKEVLGEFDSRLIPGSFHAWLRLPEPWRAVDFNRALRGKGVSILATESFAVGRFPAPQAVRISISAPPTYAEEERGLGTIREQLQRGVPTRMTAI